MIATAILEPAGAYVEQITEGITPFTIAGVTFRCWTMADGTFEWRSIDNRLVVGRNSGKSTCWAAVNGHERGRDFKKLRDAMAFAVGEAAS